MAHGTFSERDFLFFVLAVVFVTRLHLDVVVDGTRSRRGGIWNTIPSIRCFTRHRCYFPRCLFGSCIQFVSSSPLSIALRRAFPIKSILLCLLVVDCQRLKFFHLARAGLLFQFSHLFFGVKDILNGFFSVFLKKRSLSMPYQGQSARFDRTTFNEN